MKSQNPSDKTTVRNLTIFIILVLASGWIGWGLDRLMGNPSVDSLGMLVWITTPLIVSLLLRTFAGDGWKDFGIKPNFKGNWIWYPFSILVFPVVTALVVLVGSAFGWIRFPNFAANTPTLILQSFAVALLPQFIKNFFEEVPWRGYLAPKVYSLGINDYVGHTIVGLVWGAWHIPYYLFFLSRATLADFSTLNVWAYILLAIWILISWAFVYGEIRLLTNSFWPAVLMHAVEDAFIGVVIAESFILMRPGTDWLISPMNGLIMSAFFILIGVGLNRIRKSRMMDASKQNMKTVADVA
ncbi:MAG: type II CAAX prenyl endopeptidase Rce1 family protein [Bacteroidota bacterium]